MTQLEGGSRSPVAGVDKEVGEAIAAARRERGMSLRDLSQQITELGGTIDASTLSRIETAKQPAKVRELDMIASVFGVDTGSLIPKSPSADVRLRQAGLALQQATMSQSLDSIRLLEAVQALQEVLRETRADSDTFPWHAHPLGPPIEAPVDFVPWLTASLSDERYGVPEGRPIRVDTEEEAAQLLALVAAPARSFIFVGPAEQHEPWSEERNA
ncbi:MULTISPECIES: helix-turn-helix domain-containing protein [unclassified Pseudoclavibacter]|uniref:helix-turn-helix domain-containing protein n=1 Tax=unclassified Pseudoclavibacter TaxID=2615177 RepID=UPI0015E40DBD|nr:MULTISPECIES: helix-turn-helix transcriptional regulator [unclassified Pseudoclavibacter]